MVDFGSLFRPTGPTPPPPVDPLARWFGREYDESQFWIALTAGPPVDELATRLSSVPQAFFDPRVDLVALAGDLLGVAAGGPPLDYELRTLLALSAGEDRSRRGAAIALWLFASESVIEPLSPALNRAHAEHAIAILALRLAPVVDPADWLVVAERREEAARAFLIGCGQVPSGEDVATAQSIWDRHDSVRRNSALSRALTDHQHRLEVVTKIQAARAAEASARYSHE